MASPTIWDEDYNCYVHAAAIADPTGGATADSQARTAVNSILAALRVARIIGRDTTATVEPQPAGASVWDSGRQAYVLAADISAPAGGATVDAELRTAIGQVLTALRGAGVLAGGSNVGPTVWDEDTNSYTFSQYTTPTGGTTTDAEGRAQLNLAAAALKSAGLLAQD